MASNTTAIVTATFLAAAIAMSGDCFLQANNIVAQMTGNMTGGTMRPDYLGFQ